MAENRLPWWYYTYCHIDYSNPRPRSPPPQENPEDLVPPPPIDYQSGPFGTKARGFLDPKTLCIPKYSDFIHEGEERLCFATFVYSTKEIYLVAAEEFPKMVNKFIYETGQAYRQFCMEPNRCALMVRKQDMGIGSIVIVNHEKEWKRAKVEDIVPSANGDIYKILLLDLGEYLNVKRNDIYFLHKNFAVQPTWAMKARLQEDTYIKYGRSYGTQEEWDEDMKETILKFIYEKSFSVKFIRQVDEGNGEKVWEITFLSLNETMGESKSSSDETILEQKIINLCMERKEEVAQRVPDHGDLRESTYMESWGRQVVGRGRGRSRGVRETARFPQR